MARSRVDLVLLFATRILRLFAFGSLSVILALYLAQAGLSEQQIGLLFTLALAGDAAISLAMTMVADRFGRRRLLVLGAVLMVCAGATFVLTSNFAFLLAAAIVGVISPSGNEIGPFLSIEQAALSQLLPHDRRTQVFAWYNLAGAFATAIGALCSGWAAQYLETFGGPPFEAYRFILFGYLASGIMLGLLFVCLSPRVEIAFAPGSPEKFLGLQHSQKIVLKLSGLFALDAFAGGLVIQSFMAYWFHLKFGVAAGVLGSIFFGANLLAGLSALLAAKIARRIGLINTMVFTHIPSNILLMLVPLMPSLSLAISLLLLRFSISQMDVPTRQSYTMAVVAPGERSAASGITSVARSVGAALSPALSGIFLANSLLINIPFFLAGGLKIIYDVLLYRSFEALSPRDEAGVAA